MLEKYKGLLLTDLESSRLQSLVSYYSVKGDPRKSPGGLGYKETREELGELEAVRKSMLNLFDIHAECEGEGRLALVRKMSPHGMNEMSVFAQEGYGGIPINNLFDFAPEVRKSFYHTGASFSSFSENVGLYPVVSYTYDPHTYDRKSPQSVKIFHLQLTARSTEELSVMKKNRCTLEDIPSSVDRRQLIDESSVLFSLAIGDYLEVNPLKSLTPIAPFSEDGCSNIRFNIGQSWDSLLNQEFDIDLGKLHKFVTGLYMDFSDKALSGTVGRWNRPSILRDEAFNFIDNLDWMHGHTKDSFKHYISGLNNRHLRNIDLLKKHKLTTHLYPVAGICISTTITRAKQGDIRLSIRPQIFAEAGATGLQYLDPIDAQVKINRGEGWYDESELRDKIKFEKDCANYIVLDVNK